MGKRLTQKQIVDIIHLYKGGMTPKEIGVKFDIYNNSVTRLLKKNDIPRNQKPIISLENKQYICNQYAKGKNSEVLAKEISIDPSTVCRILKRNNIKIRPACDNKRKYWLNETWLDSIDCEEKAYFLGLFWADGNISKSSNDILLRLHSKDYHILKSLSGYFYNTDRVTHYTEDVGKPRTPVSRLGIYSQYLKNRMIEIGLFPNKSKTVKFPSKEIITDELLRHFLRGLLDGDGCICIRNNGKATVDYTGNQYIINSINEILKQRNVSSKVYNNKKRDSWSLQINNKENIIKFLDWIYIDSFICLERKYEKYRTIKSNSGNDRKRFCSKKNS